MAHILSYKSGKSVKKQKKSTSYSQTITLQIGNTFSINAPRGSAFRTSDSNVATVDRNGVIEAVGLGTAIITVSRLGETPNQILVTVVRRSGGPLTPHPKE